MHNKGENINSQKHCQCGCGHVIGKDSTFARGHNTKIDWDMITEGFEEIFNVSMTTKEMLENLYKKYRNLVIVGEILGVDPRKVREKIVMYELPIHPRGHLKPTKLDLFNAIPEEELSRLSNKDIAKKIGSVYGTAVNYQYFRRKNKGGQNDKY